LISNWRNLLIVSKNKFTISSWIIVILLYLGLFLHFKLLVLRCPVDPQLLHLGWKDRVGFVEVKTYWELVSSSSDVDLLDLLLGEIKLSIELFICCVSRIEFSQLVFLILFLFKSDLEGVWNCGSYTIPCNWEFVGEVYEVMYGEALKNSK